MLLDNLNTIDIIHINRLWASRHYSAASYLKQLKVGIFFLQECLVPPNISPVKWF